MTSGLVGPGGAPLDTSGAKAVVGDDQLRAKQAAEEIRLILDAYDAELFPVMMLSPKGVIGVSVDVLPKNRAQAGQQAAPPVAPTGDGPELVVDNDGTVKCDKPEEDCPCEDCSDQDPEPEVA